LWTSVLVYNGYHCHCLCICSFGVSLSPLLDPNDLKLISEVVKSSVAAKKGLVSLLFLVLESRLSMVVFLFFCFYATLNRKLRL
jgi:hypothetical protein